MNRVTYTRTGENPDGPDRTEFPLLHSFVTRLKKARRFIYTATAVGTICTVGVLLLVPNKYTATTKIMPQSGADQVDRLAKTASSLLPDGALSSAVMSRLKTETASLETLLKSTRVLDSVLTKSYAGLNSGRAGRLVDLWQADNIQYYREQLLDKVTTRNDPHSGIFELAVKTGDPELSAQIANNLALELDRFKGEIDRGLAHERSSHLADRITEAAAQLDDVQSARQSFLEKNRNFASTTDPELMLAVEKFDQEAMFCSQVLYGLKQLKAYADMESRRETPRLIVVEKAQPPLVKSGPRRTMYAVTGLIASMLLAVGLVLVQTSYQHYFPKATRDELSDSLTLMRGDLEGVVWRMKSRIRSKEKTGV